MAAEHSGANIPLPPQEREAEQAVLGGLIADAQFFDDIALKLKSEDFYEHAHQLIYNAIHKLAVDSKAIDVVTVTACLKDNGDSDKVGGLDYVATLVHNTPSVANIAAYADIVRECAIRRRLIQVCHDIAAGCYDLKGLSPAALLEKAEQEVLHISDLHGAWNRGFVPASNLLGEVFGRIAKLNESGTTSPITGISTGFHKLDHMTLGLQPGELIVVAGRPSMGKTALVMNMAEHVALSENGKCSVAVFSMEMTGQQLMMRLLSSNSRVNAQSLSTGRVKDEDMKRVTSSMNILDKASIHIDDSGGVTPTELSSRARRLARETKNLGLIIVDYLQLMHVSDTKENRATEISNITRALKALSKELHVPVIALSQLNRGLEQRPDKRPIMSDLRESGAIEQDADLILFIYRDEVYQQRSGDDEQEYSGAYDNYKGNAEIIIGKQRNGPTGTIDLMFKKEIVRFDNLNE